MSPRYRFETRWAIPSSQDHLFDLLADVGGYPSWWPQVRAVARIDEDSARVVARSLLPYSLDLTLVRAVEDRAAGVLEVRIHGRLDGWSRWTLQGRGSDTMAHYEQEVDVRGRLLTAASSVARPVLVANHAWMMRGGRRGLLSRGPGRRGSTSR